MKTLNQYRSINTGKISFSDVQNMAAIAEKFARLRPDLNEPIAFALTGRKDTHSLGGMVYCVRFSCETGIYDFLVAAGYKGDGMKTLKTVTVMDFTALRSYKETLNTAKELNAQGV